MRSGANELPLSAFRVRILRALPEARFMAPGGWQDGSSVRHAEALLKRARKHLRAVEVPRHERVHHECLALILESEARLLRIRNEFGAALARLHERLQIATTAEELLLEAELFELLAATAGKKDERRNLLLAAERAWDEAERGLDSVREARSRRDQLRRAISEVASSRRREISHGGAVTAS